MENNDEIVRVKLERHLWPDEIEEKRKKRNSKLKLIVTLLSLLVMFTLGYLLGFGTSGYSISDNATNDNVNEKFSYILKRIFCLM